jgi:hypothetical protein
MISAGVRVHSAKLSITHKYRRMLEAESRVI